MSNALAKISPELVLDLINEKSSERITFSEVVFGPAQPNTVPANGRNTMMTVNALPGKAIGSKVVFYNRLDLGLLFTNSGIDEVKVSRPDNFTSILQILPEINTLYNLRLTSADIQDAVPRSGTAQTLVVRSTSYAYLGTLDVTVYDASNTPIEDVIYLNTLQGLDYMDADITDLVSPDLDLDTLSGPLAIVGGDMRLHAGYTPNKYWIGSNGEVKAAISIRAQTDTTQTEPVIGTDNRLNINLQGGTANIMVSLELNQRAGLPADIHGLTSRYEISMFLRSTAPAAPADIVINLIRTANAFQWVKPDGTAVVATEVVDGPGSVSHLLHQVRFDISSVFPEMAFDGEFIAGLVLRRKQTLAARVYVPMVFNVN